MESTHGHRSQTKWRRYLATTMLGALKSWTLGETPSLFMLQIIHPHLDVPIQCVPKMGGMIMVPNERN